MSENSKPLYNSRIIDTYLKLLHHKYPMVDIANLLRQADMKKYQVDDQAHWFTQKQIDLFYENLVQKTDNPNIAREAGRFFAAPEAMSTMRQYILGMLGPARVYESLQKTGSNFTRSSEFQTRRLTSNSIELNVTLCGDAEERKFQCENRIGFMEAISLLFTNKLPRIEHPDCLFDGGDSCRYIITWENTPSILVNRFRNLASPLLIVGSLLTAVVAPGQALKLAIPISAAIIFLSIIASWWAERREALSSVRSLWSSADLLFDQLNINYNNALLSNEIGQAISSQTTVDSILESVVQALKKRLDYDRGMILLTNPEKNQLQFRAGFGYGEDHLDILRNIAFHLDRKGSRGVFVVSFHEQKPFLINDLNDIEADLSIRSLAVARKLGAKSFICCPIVCDSESIGVLAVDNMESKRPLVQSDMSLLTGVAPVIGVSIRNAELLARQEDLFHSVLQVLSASTDARDPLTAGHSEKVTEYSLGICQQLDLPHEFNEMIRVASLLHDYGKIGIPDVILKKNGRLTSDEYEIVKTHARKTKEILRQIQFHGIYTDVPEVAGTHHEKMDGSGYPDGLIGDDIPLGARIIAVADYFEAITALRHYRSPMPINEAISLLREESGTLFDQKIVEAFISFYTKNYLSQQDSTEWCLLNRPPRRTRIPFHVSISVRQGNDVHDASSTDLSSLGLYLNSRSIVTADELVELEFELPENRPGKIRTQARVAWVNRMDERRKPRYPLGFGVEFLSIKTEERQAILDYVTNRSGQN